MEGNTPVQHVLIGAFLVSLTATSVVRSMSPLVDTNSNFVAKKFQTALNQQDLQSILSSIEKRLATLDTIYSINPAIERKFDQFARRLHGIDIKIVMLESVMQTSLDKISENISTKNFKDDMTKVSLFSKLDTLYEGISHKISHMDKKHDTDLLKTQDKVENVLTKLEKMEDNFTNRDEDIESQLAETITVIDDLRTTCSLIEHNIINDTKSYIQSSMEEIISLNDKLVQMPHNLIMERMNNIQNMIHLQIEESNGTRDVLEEFKEEIKEDLNNYANKVADMNSEIWRSDDTLETKIYSVEANVNETRIEMKNNFRNIIKQFAKMFNGKNSISNDYASESVGLDDIKENLNHNFEKLLSTQNLFLESCHRLQNDESQIESKISDLLEKLIETFEQKTSIEIKDIKNVEKLIKGHDSLVRRQLNLNTRNLVTIYNQSHMNRVEIEACLENIKNGIQELFGVILTMNKNNNENNEVWIRQMQVINNKIHQFDKQQINTEYLTEIKKILSNLELESTTEIKQNVEKIYSELEQMQLKIEKQLNSQSKKTDKNFETILKYFNGNKTNNLNNSEGDISLIINKIFDKNFTSNVTENANLNKKKSKCLPNYEGIIDVRYNNNSMIDCEENTQENKKPKVTKNETKHVPKCDNKPNYLGLLDVRNSNNNTENCTEISQNNQTTPEISNDQLLNNRSIIDLIDVRFGNNNISVMMNSTKILNNTNITSNLKVNHFFLHKTQNKLTTEDSIKPTLASIDDVDKFNSTITIEEILSTVPDETNLEKLETTEVDNDDLELDLLTSNENEEYI